MNQRFFVSLTAVSLVVLFQSHSAFSAEPSVPFVYQTKSTKSIITQFKRPKRVAVNESISAWSECGDGRGSGVTSDRALQTQSCPKTEIATALAQALNEHLSSCVERALIATGQPGALQSLSIKSLGIFGVRPAASRQRMSLHSAGRAIDIASLTVVAGQKKLLLDTVKAARVPNGLDRRFYQALRSCWSDALTSDYNCPASSQGRNRGSVGWEDRAHQDHLHLSIPYCPKNDEFLNG